MCVASHAIVVSGLEKSYGTRQVLRGVDLQVGRGEVFALLGPNGAGKTTTVEILEGFREVSAGQVRVLGLDPGRHTAELRRRVGVVLQECGVPRYLRVGELLDAWRAYYPSPRSAAELLELVELSGERVTLVRRLSGGQRRRLDFALALAGDPDLIFLDEPTTGFDPEARQRCWSVIENLSQLGKTILLTTHYLDEAERLADRVAILAGGRIRAAGTVEELGRLAGAPTEVSVQLPSTRALNRARIRAMNGQVVDGRLVIRTNEPSVVVHELVRSLGDLPGLVVAPPNLEASYFALVSAGIAEL